MKATPCLNILLLKTPLPPLRDSYVHRRLTNAVQYFVFLFPSRSQTLSFVFKVFWLRFPAYLVESCVVVSMAGFWGRRREGKSRFL